MGGAVKRALFFNALARVGCTGAGTGSEDEEGATVPVVCVYVAPHGADIGLDNEATGLGCAATLAYVLHVWLSVCLGEYCTEKVVSTDLKLPVRCYHRL